MTHRLEGTRIPSLSIRTRNGADWETLDTEGFFANKRVVVFALPGAFTPTCSSSHLPRYNELWPEFQARGVDAVVSVSVNDAFVMEAWQQAHGADHVTMLPDGNGLFSEALGMLVDKDDLGFGKRSWRYALVVRDGVIEQVFEEPREPGDPFGVSDADSVLRWLDASYSPLDVVLVGREGCVHCVRARVALEQAGIAYEEVTSSPRRLRALSGRDTTPQIFVNGEHIGGADDLERWLAERSS